MQVESDIAGDGESTPIWAAFGDLMAVLLGVFVLILVGVIGVQLHMETRLRDEIRQREVAEQRRKALEQALAAPLADGRIKGRVLGKAPRVVQFLEPEVQHGRG